MLCPAVLETLEQMFRGSKEEHTIAVITSLDALMGGWVQAGGAHLRVCSAWAQHRRLPGEGEAFPGAAGGFQ